MRESDLIEKSTMKEFKYKSLIKVGLDIWKEELGSEDLMKNGPTKRKVFA